MSRWIATQRLKQSALGIALLLTVGLRLQGQVPYVFAPRFDADFVAADDQRRAEQGELPLYGRLLTLAATSEQNGEWGVDGTDRVWHLGIASPGALGLECFLEEMDVPAGATIRIFSPRGSALSDPVALGLPTGVSEFSTPLVRGDSCLIEYREPLESAHRGSFRIAQVGHAYRDVEFDTAREGTCHVNVACHPEADGWEGPIRATVRISVVVPQGTGWCSGTLVNNVRQDCAPYILSAWHCGRTSTAAQFNQYKFFFNFQYATCNGGAYSTAQYLTGAQLKAYSDDYDPQYQGVGGSDFMLLRTNAAIPDAFAPYWAGWDATNIATVSGGGVCTHHPTGAPKRISTFTQPITTGHPMASSGLLTHYKVIWAQTVHGWGITEVGSSGSGLFKQNADLGPVLIGTCTGNSSGMNCSNHAGTAYFGKVSYDWTQNPNAANIKLKPWLDPDNTGTLIFGGSDDPCASSVGLQATYAGERPLLYPNPANEQVVVKGPVDGPIRYRLTDSSGRVVKTGELPGPSPVIELMDIGTGAYLLYINSSGKPPRVAPLVIIR